MGFAVVRHTELSASLCAVDVSLLAVACQAYLHSCATIETACFLLEQTYLEPPANLSDAETLALLEANPLFVYVRDGLPSIIHKRGAHHLVHGAAIVLN